VCGTFQAYIGNRFTEHSARLKLQNFLIPFSNQKGYEKIFKKSTNFLIWGNLVVFCDVVYDFVFSVFPLFLTRQEPSDTQLHLWFVVCMWLCLCAIGLRNLSGCRCVCVFGKDNSWEHINITCHHIRGCTTREASSVPLLRVFPCKSAGETPRKEQ
jgi:hypothetical protein